MWSVTYWKRLVEDAVKGFAGGVIGVVGTTGFNVFETNWELAIGTGVGGAVVLILLGLAGKGVGDPESTHVSK